MVNLDILIKFLVIEGTIKIFLRCREREVGKMMCPMCVIGSLEQSPSASLPVPEYSELVFMESVVEVT